MLAWFALELLPVSQLITTIAYNPGFLSTAEHFLYMAQYQHMIIGVQSA